MTEQRRKLISFLRTHPDRRLSARDIAAQLDDAQISVSAVYRNLAALEKDGYITRVISGEAREAYYQYLDTDSCRESLHLICTQCGKTIHMNASEADRMLEGVYRRDGFRINTTKTVLYGLCGQCADDEEPK